MPDEIKKIARTVQTKVRDSLEGSDKLTYDPETKYAMVGVFDAITTWLGGIINDDDDDDNNLTERETRLLHDLQKCTKNIGQ